MDFEQIRRDTELKEAIKSLETTLKAHAGIKPPSYPINEIEGLKKAILGINIPEKVTIEQKVSFSDRTRRFLVWFFVVSVAVIGGFAWFGVDSYYNKSEYQDKAREYGIRLGYQAGLRESAKFLENKEMPNTAKELRKMADSFKP